LILQLTKYPVSSIQAYKIAVELGLSSNIIKFISNPEFVSFPCLNHGTAIGIITFSPICVDRVPTLNAYIDIRRRFNQDHIVEILANKLKDRYKSAICKISLQSVSLDTKITMKQYPCSGCTNHKLNEDLVALAVTDPTNHVLIGWDILSSMWTFIYKSFDNEPARKAVTELLNVEFPSLSGTLHRFGVITTSTNKMIYGFSIRVDNIWNAVKKISSFQFPVLNIVHKKQLIKFSRFDSDMQRLVKWL